MVKGRGGARPGAGRRKGESKALETMIARTEAPSAPAVQQILTALPDRDTTFFSRVLSRIGEGKPATIKSAEDYALDLLFRDDVQTRSYNFNKFLDHIHGRPAQGVFVGDTREVSRPLAYGNMPRTIAGNTGGAGKPN